MDRKLEELREELQTLQEEIEKRERELRLQADTGLGEGDIVMREKKVDQALLRDLRQRAEAVEQTIARIEQG